MECITEEVIKTFNKFTCMFGIFEVNEEQDDCMVAIISKIKENEFAYYWGDGYYIENDEYEPKRYRLAPKSENGGYVVSDILSKGLSKDNLDNIDPYTIKRLLLLSSVELEEAKEIAKQIFFNTLVKLEKYPHIIVYFYLSMICRVANISTKPSTFLPYGVSSKNKNHILSYLNHIPQETRNQMREMKALIEAKLEYNCCDPLFIVRYQVIDKVFYLDLITDVKIVIMQKMVSLLSLNRLLQDRVMYL